MGACIVLQHLQYNVNSLVLDIAFPITRVRFV